MLVVRVTHVGRHQANAEGHVIANGHDHHHVRKHRNLQAKRRNADENFPPSNKSFPRHLLTFIRSLPQPLARKPILR
jgi:hypothetical protein